VVVDAVEERVQAELLAACDEPRSIVVKKGLRQLELRCGAALAARYDVSLEFEPVGAKEREGDGRTPEGEYFISAKFSSQFHRSLRVAYPNAADAARGLEDGLISRAQHDAIVGAVTSCRMPPQDTSLGSLIEVHGAGGGSDVGDWTLGCVALDNDAIEAVFAFHRLGCGADGAPRTRLLILP
jgi:murein L,D-transpeptidase YafK